MEKSDNSGQTALRDTSFLFGRYGKIIIAGKIWKKQRARYGKKICYDK